MSTRSYIGISDDLFKTNAAKCIYCHFDGYWEGVGLTLAECYNSKELAEKLTSKGNLDSLENTIEENDYYDSEEQPFDVNFTSGFFIKETAVLIDYFYVFDRRKNKWFEVSVDNYNLFPTYTPLRKLLKEKGILPRKKK